MYDPAMDGMTDASMYDPAMDGMTDASMYDPAMDGMTDASMYDPAMDGSGMTDASMYDPSMDGMADVRPSSGPSCFTIEFFDGSFLKEGQTVFVSYDGGGGLVDSNENSINSFSQIVNNSSTVYNDETAPTLMAAPMPSLNADGQTISLQFSESIDQSSVYNALQNFKLFVDGIEQTGSFTLEPDAINDASGYAGTTADASGMAYDASGNYIGAPGTDASGNSSSSSFTLRFNGTTIESGQSVLLSYANTNTDYTDSGITDLAGNDLASFAFQLDNMSGQDFTNPELTDGFVDDNGSSITVNVSEFIGFDLNQNDASGMGFDASGADGSNFDWNSEAIKEAFTLNVNGRDLNSADFSLSYDSAMQNIVVNLEPSAQIFAGQSVTLDFDSTKITANNAPQITDSNGNPLQPNTIIIDNDSFVADPNPSYDDIQSQLEVAQQEVTDKTNNLNNLQSQFDTLQTDYNAALADAAVTEAERNQLQNDLQQTQSDLDQANNDLQFAQAELSNLQGQLDAIPAQVTNGWSESSGQSITIEFDQSISSNNGDDLFSLINNNSLSVYIDGEQLTSTDISNIYFGNPSYDASGGMTDASMYDPAMDGMTDASMYDPAMDGMTDASMYDPAMDGMTDASMYDPAMDGMADASGMSSGPSCFTIEFFDGSFLKEGQTVFVSYDGGGGLVDSNENSINSFSQIVNNSSTVYNDETAPTLMAAPMPSLNADGQTISLQFSESIDQSSVYNALQNFKLFVDGIEQTGSFTLEPDAINDASGYAGTTADASGMAYDASGN